MSDAERSQDFPISTSDLDAIESIDQVIAGLQAMIAWAKHQPSRIGYFAALYLRVTATLRDKVGTGFFDDDARMERMVVAFAKPYFLALRQFHDQDPALLASWKLAFDATTRDDLLIVQQLLGAMNPHINIDLATAAAEICPGESIDTFRADFDRINQVLGGLVPTVISEIDDLSPLIRLVMDLAEQASIAVINFSMDEARDFAWRLAVRLARATPEEQAALIADRDAFVTRLGGDVLDPGEPWRTVVDIVRAPESQDVRLNIEALDRGNPLPRHPAPPSPSGEPPNRVYYFEIADGSWTGTFTFRLTSWRRLWASEIGLVNKLLASAMAVFQTIFGDGSITST
ncbi:MAG: DUF5995 family protein, partial [Acidobacteriota bacterium]